MERGQVSESRNDGWQNNVAHSTSESADRYAIRKEQEHAMSGVCCEDVADTISTRQQGQGEPINAINSTEAKTRKAVNAFDGSQPGFWTTEPFVGRVANGIPNRIHRLKGLGNAQVPLQAAAAWKLLGGQ